MLAVSAIDIITSVIWIFTQFFVSPGFDVMNATGNQATCDAQGFIAQFSSAGFLYMVSLQIYVTLWCIFMVYLCFVVSLYCQYTISRDCMHTVV